MKISFTITKSEPGGAQSHVLELMTGLTYRGHETTIATGDEGWLTEQLAKINIKATIIPDLVHPIDPVNDFKALLEIRRWLRKEQPDLLHAHSSKAGLIGRIAARTIGLPSVFTAHGWAFTDGASITRKLVAVPSEWVAAKTGGDIICVSKYDHALARRFKIAPDTSLHTVWNGIDDVSDSVNPTINPEPVITMVARFAAPKDHSTLLHAVAAVSESPWRLRLVGDGPLLTDAVSLASSLGITDRVDFLGARTDVAQLLASSDIFVLASRFEGLPISILEAMRAGLPVVASNVGGVPELVTDKSGILVPASDPDSLATAIRQLVASHELRIRLGRNGRIKFKKDFRVEGMMEKIINVYNTCLARSGSHA